MNTDIQLLIEKCNEKDIRAQEQLYKLFYNYGMSIVVRYAHNLDLAGEIYNDGFLKVFNNIKYFNRKKSFKAWLRKILINTAIDCYRKEMKHSNQYEITTDEDCICSDSVVEKLNAEDIIKAIHELPHIYRIVFNLYEIEGYKHEEIAEKLKITKGTSRSCLSRAKSKLRKIIAIAYEF